MPSHTKFQQLALTGLMQKRSGCLPAALSRFGWGIQPGTKKTAGLGGKSLLSSKTTIYLQAETELKHPGTKWFHRLPDAWDCGYAIPNQHHPGFLFPPAPKKPLAAKGETLAAHSCLACWVPSTWPTTNSALPQVPGAHH